MSLFTADTARASYTLRALAHLLRYPDAALREHIAAIREMLRAEAALGAARLDELDVLLDRLENRPGLASEADYVALFDRGHRTSLLLFEHVLGDSRERGQAMIDLVKTYEAAGLQLQEGELPDYLPVALEFASTQPPDAARAFLREIAHILKAIFSALQARHSAYASALAALLDLAGEPAEAVALPEEPDLDEEWAEPAAFAGCSTAGQSRPGTEQPIHFVQRDINAQQKGSPA